MSEENNINLNSEQKNKELKKEEIEQHFPEDSHAPKEPQASNPAPITIGTQTTNMEVHKHPHHVTNKKKWGEYFLEFLMIFLAVTLGFFAENFRERIAGNRQIHEYMQSMINDLQSDMALYRESIAFNNEHDKMIDSIITSISQHRNNTSEIYFDARKLTMGTTVLTPDSKTFEQMKSSSGFRLIKKRSVADSIAAYYQWTKKFEYWSDLQRQRIVDITTANDKLFSATEFFSIVKQMQHEKNDSNSLQKNPALLTTDPATINAVLMRYQYYYSSLQLMDQRADAASRQASMLIEQIKREYDIK